MQDAVRGFFAGLLMRPHDWGKNRIWFDWFLNGRMALLWSAVFTFLAAIFGLGFVAGFWTAST